MKFIADFHIHSHYSIATSKNLNPEHLDYWAKIKGVTIVGTGDFTHPGWLAELKEKLEPAEQGLYKLKNGYKIDSPFDILEPSEIRFILTAEISTIYKKKDKIRKVHHLIFAPDFETAENIQVRLSQVGNIHSDGRPILGLDSRNLLEIALEANENILFIPAHIWTPWFSVLGDKSGFDSIAECYDDLVDYIYAIETGLSSDPPMNWICSFLDNYTIISNSDAHSPEKLGREANIFNTEISYHSITEAIKKRDVRRFLGTIEFFPQEGKYHHDGHRKCKVNWDPSETKKNEGICPVCGKKVTVGVMNRVMQLSDRKEGNAGSNCLPFYSIIPLKEILSEILSVSQDSNKVKQVYNSLIKQAGSEFNILLYLTIDEIKKYGNGILAEAIQRMRDNKVYIEEGFDGEYGRIKVFLENEQKDFNSQVSLLNDLVSSKTCHETKKKSDTKEFSQYKNSIITEPKVEVHKKREEDLFPAAEVNNLQILNPEQELAIQHFNGPALVIAGPGTGKTRVLTHRIVNLIKKHYILPENILAVTFTNKAAIEMKTRIKDLIHDPSILFKLTVSTFHSFGYSIIKKVWDYFPKEEDISSSLYRSPDENFSIISDQDKYHILDKCLKYEKRKIKKMIHFISLAKQNLKSCEEIKDEELKEIYIRYGTFLHNNNLLDLDDLILYPVQILTHDPRILLYFQEKYRWILIDEYQDINYAQYLLIKTLLPEKNSNLYVIGDPAQAIYGFRGADIKFINRFLADYPAALSFRLTQSYRCSDSILKASHNIIKIKGEMDSLIRGIHEGTKITIVHQNSDKSEAEYVARTIEKMIGGLRFFSLDSNITEGNDTHGIQSLSDFAVLCRTNGQIQRLEKAFRDHNIPYQTIDDLPFFKKEPVCSIIDILKLVKNRNNNYLKNKLVNKNVLRENDIQNLYDQLGNLNNVKQILNIIIDNFFQNQKLTNQLEFKRLINMAVELGDKIDTFIQHTDTGSAIDAYQADIENVSLMTLHAAKGLEFSCVFITGCEDGLLPLSLFGDHKSDVEEERRLLYVGMTRAKRYLFLTYASKRLIRGKAYHLTRSPFLDSIEQELIELAKHEYKGYIKRNKDQLSLF
jgi:DNA helicase-2/ATP-dependent DNA helicase PcrA